MGKRDKKTGKGRLDKYYKLAKEQGYRARSAFKLIQLDKKYELLKDARCLIDLCAAPGGWLQVATKYMPPNSIILGVDLTPIKPIPRCITFADDITSDTCRRRIREEIKDWKADVVLHDGAPNVGTAWAQDAFAQSELVLASLKLATEFLGQGGTFVTKVFRSKDYNSLMWVFNQLFAKVEATKPPSSRNVSAEIFVVCQGFLAPKRLDPRFLNPQHVFKDLDLVTATGEDGTDQAALNKAAGHTSMDKLTPAAMKVFHPEKKRRAREGYEEGNLILHKSVGVMKFIASGDPITVLGDANQLVFQTPEEKALLPNDATTEEVKGSCEDLKVLGKKDFKNLLKWRVTMREELGLDSQTKETGEFNDAVEVSEMPELDEEEQMDADIARMKEEEASKKRRDKRRSREKKMKDIQRLQLHMTTPVDMGLERQDQIGMDDDADFMFDLNEVEHTRRKGKRVSIPDNAGDFSEGEDEESENGAFHDPTESDESEDEEARFHDLEANLDLLYDEYQNQKLEKDAKHRVREARKKRDQETGNDKEWGGIKDGDEAADDDEDDEEEYEDDAEQDSSEADDALAFDRRDDFVEGSDDDEDDDAEEEEDEENIPPVGTKRKRDTGKLLQSFQPPKQPLQTAQKSRAVSMWYDQPVFKGIEGLENLMSGVIDTDAPAAGSKEQNKKGSVQDKDSATKTKVRFDDEPTMPASKKRKGKQSDPRTWEDDDDDEAKMVHEEENNAERIARYGLTTPEAMTIAQQLVNRETTATLLMDEGFNKHAFNDKDGLPSWFLDDEMKHFRTNVPVTKEAVEAIRAKLRALNARPIKKVAEAKARKRMRAFKRIANAQKKAENVLETDDLSEKEKAAQISRLVSRATKAPKKAKKDEVKVIVARGATKGVSGRPKGIKGKYKMVDSRGKKEVRALKRIQKRDGPKRKK